MKRITVYADFDFLAAPLEIGTLGYERVRGKDHFVFEYSREWLKQHGGIVLSGDLMNVPSLQHPRGADSVFGFVKDSFPDRWGRMLLDRRERLKAQSEGRPVRMLPPKGWTLSPAYDINPGTKMHQCILIDQYTEQSDAGILLQSSSRYMLEKNEAMGIIEEVRSTIKDWRKTATELQISHKIFEPYCNRWDSL